MTVLKSSAAFLHIRFFGGDVDLKEIDEDCKRITAYYRGLGFFQARVGRVLEYSPDQDWLTVTFVVDEGIRSIIRNIGIVGNTKVFQRTVDGEAETGGRQTLRPRPAQRRRPPHPGQVRHHRFREGRREGRPPLFSISRDRSISSTTSTRASATASAASWCKSRGESPHANHHRAEPPLVPARRRGRHARDPRQRAAAEGLAALPGRSEQGLPAEDRARTSRARPRPTRPTTKRKWPRIPTSPGGTAASAARVPTGRAAANGPSTSSTSTTAWPSCGRLSGSWASRFCRRRRRRPRRPPAARPGRRKRSLSLSQANMALRCRRRRPSRWPQPVDPSLIIRGQYSGDGGFSRPELTPSEDPLPPPGPAYSPVPPAGNSPSAPHSGQAPAASLAGVARICSATTVSTATIFAAAVSAAATAIPAAVFAAAGLSRGGNPAAAPIAVRRDGTALAGSGRNYLTADAQTPPPPAPNGYPIPPNSNPYPPPSAAPQCLSGPAGLQPGHAAAAGALRQSAGAAGCSGRFRCAAGGGRSGRFHAAAAADLRPRLQLDRAFAQRRALRDPGSQDHLRRVADRAGSCSAWA